MLNNTHAVQRLSPSARRDLQWWKTLLPVWSGIAAIAPIRKDIIISTDASGSKGIGGFWFATNKLFSIRLPRRHRRKHINFKEMLAVLYAFAEWCEEWKGGAVTVKCDNTAVFNGINKKSIRGPAIEPLQKLLLLAGAYDIVVRAIWISTEENAIADALSRFDKKRLTNLLGVQAVSSLPSRQSSQITQKISRLMRNTTSTTA
jgi:hypothetical protein